MRQARDSSSHPWSFLGCALSTQRRKTARTASLPARSDGRTSHARQAHSGTLSSSKRIEAGRLDGSASSGLGSVRASPRPS
eukprot:1133681-Prymnesium_polylepis.1